MKIENGSLVVTVQGIEKTVPLPTVAADAKVKAWAVPADYRADGLFVAVTEQGQPEEIPACDLSACEFLGELDYPADEGAALNALRQQRLRAMHEAVDAATAALTAGVSQTEQQTWPTQLAEAQALDAWRNAPALPPNIAPLLTVMATARGYGESVFDLADKVLAAAAQYTAAAGPLVAWGQRTERELMAAADAEALMSVSITPPAPAIVLLDVQKFGW